MTVSNAHIYKLTERHELRKFGINAVEVPCVDKVILNLITINIHIYTFVLCGQCRRIESRNVCACIPAVKTSS